MQTIDTAPKDRELILYCSKLKKWVMGRYRTEAKNGKEIVRHACWIDCNSFVVYPTHWAEMLPDPE